MIPPQLDLHTIDIITVDLIKWIKKARPAYQFGTDKEWDSLIERVTGYRTEEGMNDMLLSIEKRLGFHPSAAIERDKVHTPIICLCGSTRFTRDMLIKQWELTKKGYIVVSWCALPDDYYEGKDKAHIGDQEGVKSFVDEVHKRKIDISDEVLVIDINGYVGESTLSEIDYAIKHGKPVRYLSEELRQAGKQEVNHAV